MPYKSKPIYKKNRKYKRRKYKQSAGSIALSMVKRMKSQMNSEKKFFQRDITIEDIDWLGQIDTINQIPQGITDITRIGDSLKMTGIHINFKFNNSSTTNFTATAEANLSFLARLIVFYDKQNTINSVSDYLQLNGVPNAPLQTKNHDKRFETRLILDKTFSLSKQWKTIVYSKNYKVLNLHTQFNASTTTINTGALKILVISDRNDALGDTFCDFAASFKVYYVDN